MPEVNLQTNSKNEIFPKHKNVDKYLRNQPNDKMLSIIDINGNG